MNKLYPLFLTLIFNTILLFSQEEVKKDSTVIVSNVELDWMPFYEDALDKAKKENKLVLVYFTGSDWCGPCKVLDKELFHTEKFKEFSDKELVLLEVDIPRNQDILSDEKISENLYLQRKYSVKTFPTILFLNHRGRKVSEKKGYILPEYYFPYIQSEVYKKKERLNNLSFF